jgi:adenylate cyclase
VSPPDFRYCPKCGAEIAASTRGVPQSPARVVEPRPPAKPAPEITEAERRSVTVLFADVVGFTSLAESIDPEELRSLMMGCFQALAEEIRRYDGFIEKFIGDAILAVFGAPVAHEDDPERAVRAALGMQARLEQLRARISGSLGEALTMRIGINTGLVVAGVVGEGKDYGVVGDTVNVAARLQQIGAPGKVTASEETYRLVRKAFECRDLGTVTLKGKGEQIQAFEVVGLRRAQALATEPEWPRAPFIGREEELKQFAELFGRARKGRTQVVTLVGDAGIGKSRLLAEFLHRLDGEGLLREVTLYQTACPALGSEAYRVFIDFFRICFGLSGQEESALAKGRIRKTLEAMGARVEPIVPVVEHLLGLEDGGPRLGHLDPEQLKRQLFLAVKEICQCQCRRGPVLLVVEDFQWADAASVELLRSLVDRSSEQPLILVLVARPTSQTGAIYSPNVDSTTIRLQPLTQEESEKLLGATVGQFPASSLSALRELVIRRTVGNPFFLEEAIRSLFDTGVLVRTPDGARLEGQLTSLEIPTTIQGVILSRLDSLDPGAKQVLLEATVIGPSFELDVLRQIVTQPQELQAHLETLLHADLLAEVPGAVGRPPQYRFRNSMIQEVAYGSLLRRRRAALHERIAQSLEHLHARELDEYLPQLAHHYALSEDRERALHYLLRFGDKATRIYANQDALGCYRRALEILEQHDGQPAREAEVLEKLADAHNALGEPDAALKHWQTALTLYEALGKTQSVAAVHRKIGLAWWSRGDRERAVEHFQRGLALLAEEPENVEAALLYHELGRLHFRIGDDEQAIAWAQQALELGQRLQAPEVISQAYNTLGVSKARRGELEEGIARVELSLQTALQHDLPGAACRAYTNLGTLLAAVDRDRAIRYCEEGLALAKKIGDLAHQSWLYASMASSYCSVMGDCSEGIEAAKASIALDQQLGQRNHLPIPLILLAQIHQCQDQLAESERYYLEACAIAEEIGEPQLLFPCYDGLATLYLAMGQTAKAEAYLAKGQEVCQKTGYTPDALIMLPFLC